MIPAKAIKKKVLVFPCGSEIGLEIHEALKWSTHIETFGASSVSSNHGRYVYKNYIEGLPFVDEQDFIAKLNGVVESRGIDLIYPAHDSVVLRLAENLGALLCDVVGSPLETCRIARSKLRTFETLRHVVSVPKVYGSVDERTPFPVFMKPDVGQGSRGTHMAFSLAEAEFYMKLDPTLILMEYLPGKEYTVDCFTDRHGKLRFVGPRERLRVSNGISVDTVPAKDAVFHRMAEKINKTLRFRGAWFFQAKRNSSGEPALLEIAPRIAGAMGLYRNLGVNLALLSVFDRLGFDVEIAPNSHDIEMDRALVNRFRTNLTYRHVYIDLDDTLITSGKVNEPAMAFVYQCVNRGIKVHLLSRHAADIAKTLRQHRLVGVFDSVIRLGADDEKADYITEESSIFIDDSFSERRRVSERLGIAVFDLSALESLIDWRT